MHSGVGRQRTWEEVVMELLTVDEVVDLLRISRDTVYRLVAAGKLPARKVGRQWRFPRAELEKHVGEVVE
jgi:excisionase family DNA binding protein